MPKIEQAAIDAIQQDFEVHGYHHLAALIANSYFQMVAEERGIRASTDPEQQQKWDTIDLHIIALLSRYMKLNERIESGSVPNSEISELLKIMNAEAGEILADIKVLEPPIT